MPSSVPAGTSQLSPISPSPLPSSLKVHFNSRTTSPLFDRSCITPVNRPPGQRHLPDGRHIHPRSARPPLRFGHETVSANRSYVVCVCGLGHIQTPST